MAGRPLWTPNSRRSTRLTASSGVTAAWHGVIMAEPNGNLELSSEVIREIMAAIKSLRYGSVEIVVHDAKVVQIERKEKLRFDAPKPDKKP